jgi:hypothetical protein
VARGAPRDQKPALEKEHVKMEFAFDFSTILDPIIAAIQELITTFFLDLLNSTLGGILG